MICNYRRVLPDGYEELSWLGSTSDATQYIDTGYAPTVLPKVICSFCKMDGRDKDVFGVQTNASGGIIANLSDVQSWNRYGHTTYTTKRFDSIVGKWVEMQWSYADAYMKYDGNEIDVTNSDTTRSTDFSMNSQSIRIFTARHNSYSRFEYFKLYDGNSLVRDMVPALRSSDNVAGMYDFVTETFYTNAGTGSFEWQKKTNLWNF